MMNYIIHTPSSGGPDGALDLCLKDILSCIKPTEDDRLKRVSSISELTTIVRSLESLKDVVVTVRPFGSFLSNLYTKHGDLDISVELSQYSPSSTEKSCKQKVLRDIMKVLRRDGACNVRIVPHARVPLLIFQSRRYNVSCDVSIDNHLGWMKSKILLLISGIDDRFHDMILLAKEWAKAHYINDPKTGTLNSFSLSLLVIFHLQTCVPAVLPPLKEIYGGNLLGITGSWSNLERQIENECTTNIARFKYSRQANKSTLSQLLVSFIEKFAGLEVSSSHYAISTHTGQWEQRKYGYPWSKNSNHLLVGDPFEQGENAARAVSLRGLQQISEAFIRTSEKLSSHSIVSDRNALLECLVRPDISSQVRGGAQHSYNAGRNQQRSEVARVGYLTVNTYIPHGNERKPGARLIGNPAQSTGHEKFQQAPRVDKQSQSSGTSSQPRVGSTGYVSQNTYIPHGCEKKPGARLIGNGTHSPAHTEFQQAARNEKQHSERRSQYLDRGDNKEEVVHRIGYAVVCSPPHEKHQEAARHGESSLSVNQQRRGHENGRAQQATTVNRLSQLSNMSSQPRVQRQSQYSGRGEHEEQVVHYAGYAVVCSPPRQKHQEGVNQQRRGHSNGRAQRAWRARQQYQ